MADGSFLMRDRRVLTVDEPAVLDAAQAVTERVWQRMVTRNPEMPPPPDSPAWLRR
jgi:5-methylthioadenosine/S-adenosylhomocysteine deaminase